MSEKLRVLHAIHDFLPRHRAGSEIYANELCRRLQQRHHVTVLCAEYDPTREHASVTWRDYEGLSVVEVVNNWQFDTFADTYRSARLNTTLEHVLRATGPDVLHIHNLLNLSFDLPVLARRVGIPSVATLHDYTLVCPSGGQRVHLAEQHVCDTIDAERCSRCFPQSVFYQQMTFGRVSRRAALARPLVNATRWMLRRVPALTTAAGAAVARVGSIPVTPHDISLRMEQARKVFDGIDLFVAPSPALASEYVRLGVPASKLRVSDYGFPSLAVAPRAPRTGVLRLGFVGTLVWHKGAHVVVDAVTRLDPHTYELKIFGDVNVFPVYSRELRDRSAGLPVHFFGGFDSRETAEVFRQFDVLIVPSLWPENSPLVIHEAFMAGVPVIGARVGGIPDLVTDEVNGLLYDASSAAALAAVLRRLIEQPELLERFSARLPGVKTIDDDAAEWDGIYRNTVAEHRHRAAPVA